MNLQELMKLGLWRSGITYVFEKDDGGDTGGAAGGGGKEDDSGGKGGSGGGDGQGSGGGGGGGDDKNRPSTYEVKVDGETKQLTLDELKTLATKSAGADKRFTEAADQFKKGKEGFEIKEAFKKVFGTKDGNVDEKDIRKLAVYMDEDPDKMLELFQEEVRKSGGGGGGKSKDTPPKKVTIEDLDEDTRSTLNQARQDQIDNAEIKVEKMCQEGVDKDDFFGKILKESPVDIKENRKAAIMSMVQQRVREKILASPYTKEKFGTEMIQSAIQGVRDQVKKLGIPTKSSRQPGLALASVLGLGVDGNLPAEVHSDDDIKRVSSDDPDYDDNVVKRLGQKFVKSIRNRGLAV